MATFTWYLQGTSPTTIDATDKFQFAGGTFDSAITVGAYNASSHVKSSGNADDSSGNGPKNSKFISQTGGTAGKSQAWETREWREEKNRKDVVETSYVQDEKVVSNVAGYLIADVLV